MIASLPDLLRLVAVPALGWAAWRDLQVRRVPNRLWYPLAALGAVLLVWEGWSVLAAPDPTGYRRRLFLVQVAVSLGVVVPLSYLVWRVGGFGGADAKALMALAVLFPTVPTYAVPPLGGGPDVVFPLTAATLGAFSLTVLTNTVVVAMGYPLALVGRNLLAGNVSPLMIVGTRVPTDSIPDRHGSLLETPDGWTRRGLDVDALRMYLRWRETSLAELRADPARFRDPASLPDDPAQPGDGAIADGGVPEGASGQVDDASATAPDDAWGAEAFLADVPHAWGTTPDDLRDGLEVLTTRDAVWYSPGIPFVVPMFLGLVTALVYGDLLVSAMLAVGLV
ncbi:MAG: prepilin peptidase [Halobacteriales archaeon]